MKKTWLLTLFLTLGFSVLAAGDAAGPATESSAANAKYRAVIDQRASKIVETLGLGDTNTMARVHDIILGQYRALNDWHGTNDAKLKAARHDAAATASLRATLKALHEAYLSALAGYLSPDQIEKVKDAMTYGKVQFTFNGYCSQYSTLSETNKQAILRMLKDAREEAMDAGSAKDKTSVFQRYKGRINNYLSKQGIVPDKQK
jgi:type VI protein secretion system component VasK